MVLSLRVLSVECLGCEGFRLRWIRSTVRFFFQCLCLETSLRKKRSSNSFQNTSPAAWGRNASTVSYRPHISTLSHPDIRYSRFKVFRFVVASSQAVISGASEVVHTYIHKYIHTDRQTYVHTQTHTHTHTRESRRIVVGSQLRVSYLSVGFVAAWWIDYGSGKAVWGMFASRSRQCLGPNPHA